jgi:PAS domain S-box-containing protein
VDTAQPATLPTLRCFVGGIGENGMTAIIRVDRNGTISHWNSAAERLFGFTQLETIGNSLELIIPPGAHACHGRGFARYVDTGTSTLPEVAIAVGRHKNGESIRFQISTTALTDEAGSISEVEGVMRAC